MMGETGGETEKRSKPEGPALLSQGLTTPAEPVLKMQPGTSAA